eukprot:7005251-Ditylum_brightwellii.AAC.1
MEKAEQQFKSNHIHINNTPFDLEETNINVTSLAWANELKIELPTGNKSTNKSFVDKIEHSHDEDINNDDKVFAV